MLRKILRLAKMVHLSITGVPLHHLPIRLKKGIRIMNQIIKHPIITPIISGIISGLIVVKVAQDWIIAPFPEYIGDWHIEQKGARHIIATLSAEPIVYVIKPGQEIKPGINERIFAEKNLVPSTLRIICENDDTTVEVITKEDVGLPFIEDGSILYKFWYKFDNWGIMDPMKRQSTSWNSTQNRLSMNDLNFVKKIAQNQQRYLYFWINDDWYPMTGFRLSHSEKIMEIVRENCGW